eukprot:6052511-Pyramimonas_sp.AAC.1
MGYLTPPIAPRLRGYLERFVCCGAQHPPLSEQTPRMSRARRWLLQPRRPRLRGYLERWGPSLLFRRPSNLYGDTDDAAADDDDDGDDGD